MRTPSNRECPYFYGDYYRGREKEECRLCENSSPPISWQPEYCSACAVPDIVLANACEFMVLGLKLKRTFPTLKRQLGVTTYCQKSHRANFDPYIGCGECHGMKISFGGEDE